MNKLMQELLDQPDLHEYRRRLEEAWHAEQARRAEYLDWLDEDKRAEWINGEIVVHSPERWGHARVIHRATLLIAARSRRHDLGETGTNNLVRFVRNDYIPDLCYWPAEVVAGFGEDTAVFPPPAVIMEVLSLSTRELDRGIKFQDYAAGGVREYWLVDTELRSLERFERVEDSFDGHFELRQTAEFDRNDIIESAVVEGLRFSVQALFDESANSAAVRQLRDE